MIFSEQVRNFTSQQASRMIVELLGRVTDKRLIQMTYLGEKLTNDEEVVGAIRAIREMLQSPDHSTKQLFYRVLNYLPKQNRVRIFHTLFNNAWFVGGKKRDFYEENYGFRPPFIMILSPTWQCNLRCAGCYTLGQQRHPGLEYDLVKRILKEAQELGIYFVTILGGEPFVYPHLFQMLEEHPDIFFQVYTNGTLMDKEKAHRIAELGNVAVVVSCEGYEEETDRWRGKGVYRKIMDAMDYLREARVILGSSATVTTHNVETVASDEFVDLLIEKGVVAQMYFLYIPVNGQGDINLMVTPEQRDFLRRQVIRFRREKPLFVLDFWNDGPHVEGCIAGGRRYFHINANGDVEPCVYTHIAEHNIRDVSLAEALDSKLFRCIRHRQPHNPNHLRPCMIIDNPKVYREVIEESGAYFTHPGAEEVVTDMAKEMDAYAERFAVLAEKVWQEEYVNNQAR
ncbi:MAG: radical SAM protein [Deltaproteobacteria bacterium]|nr:radical SAM protein [Deltaproteobacteria bacterium]MBW2120844.1 radical SAM protein [Deltaproteobacteria bacterium]